MSEGEKEFVPQAVRCPGCGQSYHQTTPEYDPERCAHGRMFVLMPAYGVYGANWSSFPFDESVRHGDLLCPGCGAPYTNGGNSVTLRDIVSNKAERAALEDEQADNDPEVLAHRARVEAEANEAANVDGVLADGEDVTGRIPEELFITPPVVAEVVVAPVAKDKKSIRIGGK